jgi:hypothetical protein
MASKTTAAGSPFVLGDNRHVVAFAPGFQLLAGGGAEGVAGGEQHALALVLEILGQLADRGRLAGAVDAGDHDHERLVAADIERLLERLQGREQGIGERLLDALRRIQLVALGGLLQFVEQMAGRLDADVAGQQQGFQFLEQLVVDLAAREDGLELAAPLGARLGQALEQALAPGSGFRGTGSLRQSLLGCWGRRGGGFFQETEHGKWGLKPC